MQLAKAFSGTLVGIDAELVEVEAQVSDSLKSFTIIGLPDSILKESRYRVRCATENTGFVFPFHDVVVSLAPASIPKVGAGLDLPIALSILAAEGYLDLNRLTEYLVVGELALDGKLKPVLGTLALALCAKKNNFKKLIIPSLSFNFASLLPEMEVYPLNSLRDVVALINKEQDFSPLPSDGVSFFSCSNVSKDFSDVVSQYAAKRAAEIVAAGGHNLLMCGPPGSGKSMIAERIPSLMPELTNEAFLEVLKVKQASPAVNKREVYYTRAPFRSPHHTASTAGIIGGGSNPRPGDISLAHRGILFLDELPEYKRDVIEALRQPLESGRITISRAKYKTQFPADFILVAAMNPCPCGRAGSKQYCRCTKGEIYRYHKKISAPILDRIDLKVWFSQVDLNALSKGIVDPVENQEMKKRVKLARRKQYERFSSKDKTNSKMSNAEIRKYCSLCNKGKGLLTKMSNKYQFSARSYNRVLKVSRTIADLSGAGQVRVSDLSEALSYRITEHEGLF